MAQLIEENSMIDPSYVEDFLLTHRTFIPNPNDVASKLLEWFDDSLFRDRVSKIHGDQKNYKITNTKHELATPNFRHPWSQSHARLSSWPLQQKSYNNNN